MTPPVFRALVLGLGLSFLCGCGDDDPVTAPPAPVATGSILLTVLDPANQPLPGATVLSNPQIGAGKRTTDALGQVVWAEVPIGFYTIAATRTLLGSARDVVRVEQNGVYRVTLKLQPGVFFEPQVEIARPLSFFIYSIVDSIPLQATVSDLETAPESLAIVWSSSVEGVLSTQPAKSDGSTFVPHGPFTAGQRWITLRATNQQGLVGADSVLVTVRSFDPDVALTDPQPGSGFLPGDPILFRATVSDRETPPAGLQVVWTSDRDGVLSTGAPDAQGVSSFTRGNLSRGAHNVTVDVQDADGNHGRDSILVHNDLPQTVDLQAVVTQPAGLLLQWAAISEPEFQQFRVYRASSASGPFTLVGTIDDGSATQFQDATVTLGFSYWYKVGLYTTTGAESKSVAKSGVAGVFVNIGRGLDRMIVDPVRPYLYALDRVNNTLVFVSLDSLKVSKTMFVGSLPSDLDIDKAGNELFVANYGSSQIAVVNLDTRTIARNLTVDTGGGFGDGNPYRLACMVAGRLAWTSLDQWNSISLIDTQTGATISHGFSIYYPDLVSSPDGTHLYAGESGSSGSKIYRFDIVNGVLQQADQTPGYGYGYSTRLVKMSGNGAYVYYAARKLNSLSLGSELGTFSEVTYAASNDGGLVVGHSSLFDGNTFAMIRPLPIGGNLKAIAPDGHTLYTFDSNSTRLYVLDIAALAASARTSDRWTGSLVKPRHPRR